MATIQEAFAVALEHHQAGRLPQAEQIYRQILGLDPRHVDACHLLGLIAHQSGHSVQALELLRQAVASRPQSELYRLNLGNVLLDTGDLEQAISCFREAIRLNPDYAQAYSSLSVAYRKQAKWDQAEACCRQLLERTPDHADAHVNLGIVFQEQGRYLEASEAFRQALQLQPDLAAAHFNLGNTLRLAGRGVEAIAACQEAVRLAPKWSNAYSNLGAALEANGRPIEAIAAFQEAARLDPANIEALNNLAVVLGACHRHAEAVEVYRRVVAVEPQVALHYRRLADALRLTDQLTEAQAAYRRAVELEPGSAEAHSQFGSICLDLKQFDAAIVGFRKAAELQPLSAEAHRHLASALRQNGQLAEAIASCQRALEISPDYAAAFNTLGVALQGQRRFAEAESRFDQALRYQPDLADARFNRALGRLARGDFRTAWPDYELRWQIPGLPARQQFAESTWDGSAMPGQTILLCGEQGHGDMLQFIRYAPLVKQRVGTVLVHCNPPLADLLARCPGVDRVCLPGDPVPKFDCHIPVLSLPGIFQTGLDDIPAEVPYLHPPAELVQHWATELPPGGPLRVGIIWQAGPLDTSRWIPLEAFAPLAAIDGVQLYSLQFGPGREQLSTFSASHSVIDLADRISTFQDTAAIMRNLDLVISCDSAPLHLAGALGVPVWAALPFSADWRWLLEREDSPWYPTMRLFRQQQPGDWQSVMSAMTKALTTTSSAMFCQRGMSLRSEGRYAEARLACQQAVGLDSESAVAWSQLALCWNKLDNKVETVACCRQAARLAPESAGAHRDLAVALRAQGQLDEAMASCQQSLELQPDFASAHNTLGFCLYDKGDLAAAQAEFMECLRLQPGNAHAHNNLSVVQRELGQSEAAKASIDAALAIDPRDPVAHRNRALFWLQAGDFARGWPEYEWRSRCRKTPGDSLPQPRWDGSDFSGRTLLIYSEQGLGDVLQFVRYAPLVKQRGGRVLLQCDPPLVQLLTGCERVDEVLSSRDPLPPFDLRISLLSLPLVFGTKLETIPNTIPYLAPADEPVQRWRREFDEVPGFKVGITWQGSRLHGNDHRRSIPLESFAPLAAISGVQLYSLQFGAGSEQLPNFSARDRVIDLADRIQNMHDTAAIMRNLDLVIGCDSAPVHLAGALGVPVWTALPFTADWRWLLDRDDSPWYPTMRLFRQPRFGDWPDVFGAMAAELKELAPSRH